MAYAIIEAGGKQLRVEPGYFYDINRLAVDEDDTVTLDQVLLIENNGEVTVGQPLVEAASVEATVLRHLRGPKLIVYKMRPKKKTRKKRGHRQELTRLMIRSITVNGEVIASADGESAPDLAAPVAEVATESAIESEGTTIDVAPTQAEEPVAEEPVAEAEAAPAPEDEPAPEATTEAAAEAADEADDVASVEEADEDAAGEDAAGEDAAEDPSEEPPSAEDGAEEETPAEEDAEGEEK